MPLYLSHLLPLHRRLPLSQPDGGPCLRGLAPQVRAQGLLHHQGQEDQEALAMVTPLSFEL